MILYVFKKSIAHLHLPERGSGPSLTWSPNLSGPGGSVGSSIFLLISPTIGGLNTSPKAPILFKLKGFIQNEVMGVGNPTDFSHDSGDDAELLESLKDLCKTLVANTFKSDTSNRFDPFQKEFKDQVIKWPRGWPQGQPDEYWMILDMHDVAWQQHSHTVPTIKKVCIISIFNWILITHRSS